DDLAVAYVRLKRRPEAAAAVLERAGLIRAHPGLPPAARAGQFARAGEQLLAVREFAAAEPLLRDALVLGEQARPGRPEADRARALLGLALLGQGRLVDGASLLWAGFAGMCRAARTGVVSGEWFVW